MKKRSREDGRVTFNPVDVLVGLSPGLVEDLATFVGSTEEDLLIAFQIMPWGDRAALAAFGVIELSDQPGRRGRVAKVSPEAVELANAAFEALQSSRGGASLSGHEPVRAGDAVPLVPVEAGADFDSPDVGSDWLTVLATIESVDESAAFGRLRVSVPVADDPLGRRDVSVELTSLEVASLQAGTVVGLVYDTDSVSIAHPARLKIQRPKAVHLEAR